MGVSSSGHLQTTSARPAAGGKQRGVVTRWLPATDMIAVVVYPRSLLLVACRAALEDTLIRGTRPLCCPCRTLASLAILVLVHQSYTTVAWHSSSAAAGSTGRALLARTAQPNALFGLMIALPPWARRAMLAGRQHCLVVPA